MHTNSVTYSQNIGRTRYLYTFNGKETDNELKGTSNSLDFGARIYDPRLGRWLSVDPKASKYPYLSPYHSMANNPIAIIDNNGEENTIYLIVAKDKNGNPEITPTQAKAIMEQANKYFEKLGVKTRVVVFDPQKHGGEFNVEKIDKTDGVAVVGTNRRNITNLIRKTISPSFANQLEQSFVSGEGKNNNPEESANGRTATGNKLGIAIDFDDKSNFEYKKELNITDVKNAAINLVHGAGHNAGIDHLDDGVMLEASDMHTRANNQHTHSNKKIEESILDNKDNRRYRRPMYIRFGDNEQKDNYGKQKGGVPAYRKK